ncbi:MAG: hypothetical protein AAB710_02195 [Patescibacteria group bacterium]
MLNKKLIIFFVFLLLIGGSFAAWRFMPLTVENDTVTLREDLPPAPANYKALNEDPATVAELPEERLKQYRDEFAEVLKTIEEHPDSFTAWFNLGTIKSYLGDYTGAEEAWVYTGLLSPNQGRTHMNLADLYANKLHNYEKAEQEYLKAIEVEGGQLERTRAYRELSSLYRFSFADRKSRALDILRVGIESEQDNAELLALAGMWAWQDGLLKEAEEFYVKYLEQNPSQEQAEKDLAQIRQQMKR